MDKPTRFEWGVFCISLVLCVAMSGIHPMYESSHDAADMVAWVASFAVGPMGLLLLYGAISGKLRKEGLYALTVVIVILMWIHDINMDWFKYTAVPPK